LCSVDPGFDVDLYVRSDLRTMTQIWMGLTTVTVEESAGQLILTGNPILKRTAQQWLGFSVFAVHEKKLAANIAMRVASLKLRKFGESRFDPQHHAGHRG